MEMALKVTAVEGLLASVLFVAAGRTNLPWFWAVMVLHATMLTVGMLAAGPELREERLRPGPGGRSRWVRLAALPPIAAHLIVAGLDVGRFGWSGTIPAAVHGVAFVGYAAAMGLSVWAMGSNRFFSPVVRIQSERGHHVVDAGPYRYMRHPGYTGLFVGSLCGGVALGSWWSLVPLTPLVGMFLWRTVMEDRFLHQGLDGYAAYARRVRYRLVPGLW